MGFCLACGGYSNLVAQGAQSNGEISWASGLTTPENRNLSKPTPLEIPFGDKKFNNGEREVTFILESDKKYWKLPSKGTVEQKADGTGLRYYPWPYQEGDDEFTFHVKSSALGDGNYTMKVDLTINTGGINDNPILNPTTMEDYLDTTDSRYHFTLNEEQSRVNQTIDILDLDVEGSDVELSIISNDPQGDAFTLGPRKQTLKPSKNFTSEGGILFQWELIFDEDANGALPDYELNDQQMDWELTLQYKDNGSGYTAELPIKITLLPIWEDMISNSNIASDTIIMGPPPENQQVEYSEAEEIYTITTKENDDLKIQIPLDLYSPDSEEYQLYWKFEADWNQSYYFSGVEDPDWVPIKMSFINESRLDYNSLDITAKKGTASFNGLENDKSISKPWNNEYDGYAEIEFTDANFSTNPFMPVQFSLWAVPGSVEGGSGGNFRIGTFHLYVEEDFADAIFFIKDGSDWQEYISDSGDGSASGKRLTIHVPENESWEMDFYYEDDDFEFGYLLNKNGAKKIGSKSDTYELFDLVNDTAQNKLTLRLSEPANYESFFADEFLQKNNALVDLVIQDSEDGTQDRGDRAELFLKISFQDVNDAPYLMEKETEIDNVQFKLTREAGNSYSLTVAYPSDPEIQGFKILENGEWNFQDELLDLLTVYDEDKDDNVSWTFQGFDRGVGTIGVAQEGTIESTDGRIDRLIYTPFQNEVGEDSFVLKFDDLATESGTVRVHVFMRNTPSDPNLAVIQVGGVDAKTAAGEDLEYPIDTFDYTIYVRDGEREPIDIVFGDGDKELIKYVKLDVLSNEAPNIDFDFQVGSSEDLKLYRANFSDDTFSLEDDYPIAGPGYEDAWIRLELKDDFYWDFDSDDRNDKNASFSLIVKDASEGLPVKFNFQITTLEFNEAPYLDLQTTDDIEVQGSTITVNNIEEGQTTAIAGLKAIDPEGDFTHYYWKLESGTGEIVDFELFNGTESAQSFENENNVSILFKLAPNFENEKKINEHNCTLVIMDTKNSSDTTKYNFVFNVADVPDPPRPITDVPTGEPSFKVVSSNEGVRYEINTVQEVQSNVDRGDWPVVDLSQYFYDEDEGAAPLIFSLISEDTRYGISEEGILTFKNLPDADEDDPIEITKLKVKDQQTDLDPWVGKIVINFQEIDEPPIYSKELNLKDGAVPRFTLPEDPGALNPWDENHTVSPLPGLDPEDSPFRLSHYFKDPEGSQTPISIVEGSIKDVIYEFDDLILDPEPEFVWPYEDDSDLFNFSAPPNAPGLYTVEFTVKDENNNPFEAKFEFYVEDIPDLPLIEYEIVAPNALNAEQTADGHTIVLAHEGEAGPLLRLRADDLYDPIVPHTGTFGWGGLSSTIGGNSFELIYVDRRTVDLGWRKMDKLPDYGDPPGGEGVYEYDLTIQLWEGEEEPEDVHNKTTLPLRVVLISIPNEAPEFSTDEAGYTRSKKEDDSNQSILVISAFDPDELDDSNYDASPITFNIVAGKKDGGRFEIKKISDTSAELTFVDFTDTWFLDYENPLDANGDRKFEVLIQAFKDNLPNKPTEQWVKVVVENVVEPPVFEKIINAQLDANFSIEEEDVAAFLLSAQSVDDVATEVSIFLDAPSAQNDNQYFEIINSAAGSVEFAFKSAPDYENPVDLGADNDYTVSFTASCDGIPHSENFIVRVNDVLFPLEIAESPNENSLSLLRQTKQENEIYGFQLDVKDYENTDTNKDLLFLTSERFGFLPYSSEGKAEAVYLDNEQKRFSDTALTFGTHIMFGDLRNVGTNDAIVFDIGSGELHRIRYFKNSDGLGSFVEDPDFWDNSDLATKLDGWYPNHGEIFDIDDDGDLDIILSAQDQRSNPTASRILVLQNNYDYFADDRINYSLNFDSYVVLTGQPEINPHLAVLQPDVITQVALSDVDGDYDLDIVAIHQSATENQVAWYENSTDWIDSRDMLTFTYGGGIAQSSDMADSSRVTALQLFDAGNSKNTQNTNKFECRDILIGTNKGIFHASQNKTTEGIEFEVEPIVPDLEIKDMKMAVFHDLNGVAYTSADGLAYWLKDLYSGNAPSKITVDAAEKLAVSYSYDPENPNDFPAILVSTGTAISVYKHEDDEYRGFSEIELGISEPVKSMSFVDLNRRWAFLDYEIEDPVGIFDDQRIRADGRLFFQKLPDFDTPLGTYDGTNSNAYEAKITVRKAHNPGVFTKRNVVVRILDTDEVPRFESFLHNGTWTQRSSYTHEENVLEVFSEIKASDPENQSFQFFIKPEKDAAYFKINASTGRLEFIEHPDYDESSLSSQTYELTLIVKETNQPSQFSEYPLVIELEDGSELPFFSPVANLDTDRNYTWEYNQSDGSVLVKLSEDGTGYTFPLDLFGPSDDNNILSPPPGNDPPAGIKENTFEILTQSRGGYSWISDDNQSLNVDLFPDYNTETNATDENDPDEIRLSVLNTAGHPAYQRIIIEVPNTPDLPRSTMPNELLVAEGQLKVGVLQGYDPDGTAVAWSLDPASAKDFEIASTNVLYFKTKPDFDDPELAGQVPGEVSLLLSSDGDEVKVKIRINIQNLNDSAPVSLLDEKSLISFPENQKRVIDLEVSDPDQLTNWDDFSVSIADSPDAQHFQISIETKLLNGEKFSRFFLETAYAGGLDFEQTDPNKADADRDKIYDINVYIGEKLPSGEMDGQSHPLKIKVINQDETPPEITSANGDSLMKVTVEENQILAAQVHAFDKPEVSGSVLKYDLSDGEDRSLFRVNELNGTLEFITPPNFERPSDFDRDNIYEVQVSVSDGPHFVYQTVIVEVLDANDFPNVVDAYFQGTEDEVFEGQLAFEDEDGDVWEFVNYTLPENNGTLELFEDYSFTYTPPKDFASVDTFSIILSDPYGQGTSQVQIAMAPVNDPPVAETDYVYYTDLKKSNRLQFNVLTNDHAGPDLPAVESYQFVSHTQTDYTAGLVNLGGGSFSYTPQSGFLGEDTFTYVVADQNDPTSRSTGTVRIWIAKTATLPDWTYLRNFGAYLKTKNNWVFHENLGWLYVAEPREIIYSTSWMWSETIGWFWTGEKYFNWIYHDEHEKWLHWQGSLLKSKSWFLRDKEEKIFDRDHFIRLDIRDEVIEILPDLVELSTYIANSTYFNRSQKGSIITELNRFKHSSTLNQILEFDFQY